MGIKDVRLRILLALFCAFTWTACSNPNNEENNELSDERQSETAEHEGKGVEFFQSSFEDTLARAAQDEKLVFVFADDISARGASIVMQDAVFPLPNVGEYINERFVSYKFDVDDEAMNGPAIAARYEIVMPRTYLILDTVGNEIGRAWGSALPDQFLSMISRVLGESTSIFDEMQARYDSGERSAEFIQQYLMEATVELALLNINSEDAAQIYFEEASKYRKIAEEYFASKSYSEFINEIDAHLIVYYWDGMPRGDKLVEFVIEHYEDFSKVSSESSLAQFVLYATFGAVGSAAQAGDDRYLDYIDSLEDFPLKKAVEYERNRYPTSNFLPEYMKDYFKSVFLLAKQDWDGLYDALKKRFEKWGDGSPAADYLWAMRQLSRSEDKIHHELAIEFGQSGFEKEKNDPFIAADYIASLLMLEKPDEARRIAEEYRKGLSDSEVDKRSLKTFNDMTSSMLGKKD